MQELARSKMQRGFPDLAAVKLNFQVVFPSSYVTASLFGMGPTAGLAAGTIWDPLPWVEPQVRKDLGLLYSEAGISWTVEQTDC